MKVSPEGIILSKRRPRQKRQEINAKITLATHMKNSKPIGVVSQDVLPPKGFGMKNKQNPEFVPLITARNIAWR